jgi:hypothetical protein
MAFLSFVVQICDGLSSHMCHNSQAMHVRNSHYQRFKVRISLVWVGACLLCAYMIHARERESYRKLESITIRECLIKASFIALSPRFVLSETSLLEEENIDLNVPVHNYPYPTYAYYLLHRTALCWSYQGHFSSQVQKTQGKWKNVRTGSKNTG